MLNIAKSPSDAINYMELKKDFLVIKDTADTYNFYEKIAESLQCYNEHGEPTGYTRKSFVPNADIKVDVNKLLYQIIDTISMNAKFFIKLTNKLIIHHKDKQFEKIVDLSKSYKISVVSDKRILFESV